MAILTETGHAKNVGNFGSLLVSIDVLGPAYNPLFEELKPEQLKKLYARAKSTVQGVALALQVYIAAVNARDKAWDGLDEIIGRILAIRNIAVDSIEEIEQITALVNEIKGVDVPADAKIMLQQMVKFNISLSLSSYIERLESFAKLIKILDSSYNSPEEQLIVGSLRSMHTSLTARNLSVKLAEAALNTAKANRNQLLYSPENGLVAVANKVKAYIGQALTQVSPQYTQILGTSFSSIETFS